jgi:hypothetical protein
VGSVSTPTVAYTWGAAGLVSERLNPTTPATAKSLWYHFGPQGETRQLTNSSGLVADTYTYTAFGGAVSGGITGTDPNPFRFGGQFGYYSYWTGLVWCGSRWYEGYIARQKSQVVEYRKLESIGIPADMDFMAIRALSMEGREKLGRIRPASVGQAARIPGLTPADLHILLIMLDQRRRSELATA